MVFIPFSVRLSSPIPMPMRSYKLVCVQGLYNNEITVIVNEPPILFSQNFLTTQLNTLTQKEETRKTFYLEEYSIGRESLPKYMNMKKFWN